jgi:hypothetical protein
LQLFGLVKKFLKKQALLGSIGTSFSMMESLVCHFCLDSVSESEVTLVMSVFLEEKNSHAVETW